MSVYGQDLDWSYDYSSSEHNMAIVIPANSIDFVTVDEQLFPVGNAIGVFYQNLNNEYVCAGSIIWDYQESVLPVWGGSSGLSDWQEFEIFAFINGATYIVESSELNAILDTLKDSI